MNVRARFDDVDTSGIDVPVRNEQPNYEIPDSNDRPNF